MFHSGKVLPSFLDCTFSQIRLFNPAVAIYFLTDKHLGLDPIFEKYNIISLNKDAFYSNKVKEFEMLYNRKSEDFWTITATRLIYIENFLISYKLKNVYHFENDVLLYYNLKEHHATFRRLYDHLAITTGGSDKSMTGFLFIKDGDALSQMTQHFIDLLKIYGISGLKKKYHMDMVNEMTLMKIYTDAKYLPILPFGDYSENYMAFDSIFDPASWGQFVGGTMDGIPGAKPQDHYIGQLLDKNPDYSVVWGIDDENRKIPYFKYNGNEVKINNLHIHSKNLSLYMS